VAPRAVPVQRRRAFWGGEAEAATKTAKHKRRRRVLSLLFSSVPFSLLQGSPSCSSLLDKLIPFSAHTEDPFPSAESPHTMY
jgi:hypothetical protein